MHSRRPSTPGLLTLLALTSSLAACGRPPLAFATQHVPVAYDEQQVLDVAPVDHDRDGDVDLLVAREHDLRYLWHDEAGWVEGTLGTGLGEIEPLQSLHPDGGHHLARRGEHLVRVVHSGIGTWSEEPAPDGAIEPAPVLEVAVDLDADGDIDRARLDEHGVHVWLRDANGLVDVTAQVGANALRFTAPPRRLIARDLEGDGDLDLLVVAGRIWVLRSNGGGPLRDIRPGADGGDLAHDPAGAAMAATNESAADAGAHAAASSTGDTGAASGGDASETTDGAGDTHDDAHGDANADAIADDPAGAPGDPRADAGAEVAAATPADSAAGPWFVDATSEAGLDWRHVEGEEQWDIRPTMGPGAAWADVDADGDPDLFVAGGTGQAGRLFLNDGSGVFSDATDAWGLGVDTGAGMGVTFCDWDDDGDPDMYVTNDGPNVMWRHDGDHFSDVTQQAGTGDARWGAGASFADVDGDGDLDLFVTNYLEFDTSLIPPDDERAARRREDPIAMLPYVFPGQANVLYLNRGDGTFVDGTEAAGLLAPDGKSLCALFLDEDDDGHVDLYVANDTTPNTFWHNAGDGTFEELSLHVGLDDPRGGMGLAPGDVDDDGDEDVLLTNWQLEPNALYRSNAVHRPTERRFVPRFEDLAVKAGLAQASVGYVGWGCLLADLDNDGDLDACVVNGYTSPDYETTMQCVGQRDQLFENITEPGALVEHRDAPRWRLVDVDEAGAPFALEHASRGLAAADVDGDGDLDLLVTNNNGPLVLLLNERGGRSLRVVPEGRADRRNREAVGARVQLHLADGAVRTAFVHRGGSYLSGHERGVRFGLGSASPVRVDVRWQDGSTSSHEVGGPGVLRAEQPGG